MLSKLTIRELRAEEYQHVVTFMALLEPQLAAATVQQRMADMLAAGWFCVAVFAAQQSTPLGIAGVSYRTHLFSGKVMYVENVAFLPEVRGQGLGELLMNELKRLAIAAGAKMITLDAYQRNVGARKFYERLGYDPRGVHFVLPLD